MSINCPYWKTYSDSGSFYLGSHSVICRDGAAISFRDENGKIVARIILAIDRESQKTAEDFILSIKCSKSGRFDFESHDRNFALLKTGSNRLKMTLVRMEYPYELSDSMRSEYSDYLRRNGGRAGRMLIEDNRVEMLSKLCEMNTFTKNALKELIEYARIWNSTAATAMLLEYNNRFFSKL